MGKCGGGMRAKETYSIRKSPKIILNVVAFCILIHIKYEYYLSFLNQGKHNE